MIKGTIKINCPSGLHMRPVGILCQEAMKYKSLIEFHSQAGVINVKSVLSVLGACLCSGDEVVLVCSGPDEQEAFDHLSDLITNHLE